MSDQFFGVDVTRGLWGRMDASTFALMDEIAGKSVLEVLVIARAKSSDWAEMLDAIAQKGPFSLRSLAEDAVRLDRAEALQAKEAAAMNGRHLL